MACLRSSCDLDVFELRSEEIETFMALTDAGPRRLILGQGFLLLLPGTCFKNASRSATDGQR